MPAPGEKLTVVDLLVVTGGDWATPFCSRGYGALLVDASGRRFETVARENAVRGMSDDYFKGSRVCDPLPPSSVKYQKLVFQLPATDPVAGLAVWDWQEVSDKLGRTYVYFRIDESHHDPDLSATAWGPSRDR